MSFLCIDFGGTYIKFGVVTGDEEIKHFDRIPTKAEKGANFVLSRLVDVIFRMISEFDIEAVSIAVASPLDPNRGILYNPPNLPGFGVFDLKGYLEDRVPVPVFIDNDANLYALGEYFKGAGRGSKVMVVLTLGTGIGGGIVYDGKVWHGAHGFGGELGHITIDPGGPRCNCGNYGCLEALGSTKFLVEFVRDRLKEGMASICVFVRDRLDGRAIYECAKEGDSLAIEAFSRLGVNLGIGIATIANIFDPDCIVIGGGLSRAWEFFWESMMDEFKKRALPSQAEYCSIKRAELGDLSAIWGGYYRIKNLRGGVL